MYTIEEKINNNNKTSHILEQQAILLYDSMFAKNSFNGKLEQIVVEKPKSKVQVNESDGVKGSYSFLLVETL